MLSVKIVDKITKTLYDEVTVLVDDSVSYIKNLLFFYLGDADDISFYPNFVKLEYKTSNNEYVRMDESLLMILSLGLSDEAIIYVTNILSQIEVDGKDNLLAQGFDEMYEAYKESFVDLTEDDFTFVTQLLSLQSTEVDSLPDANMSNEVATYIERIINIKSAEAKAKKSDYQKLVNILDVDKDIKYNEYFQSENVDVLSLNISIKGSDVESGSKGRFIKLQSVFNILQLSSKIPLMAIESPDTSIPLIKVYDKITQNASAKEIKSWFMNEKKKKDVLFYKKVKGLFVKYMVPELQSYVTINILENGAINVKLTIEPKQRANDRNYDIKSLLDYIEKAVEDIIEQMNTLNGVFTQSKRIQPVSSSTISVDSMSLMMSTSVLIDKKKFTNALYKPFISNYMFELKDTVSTDVLSFYYKKYGDEESELKKGLTINIRDDLFKDESSIITLYGVKSVLQAEVITKQIVLLVEAFKAKSSKNTKVKEKSHIKELRQQGVNILSTKCQKPRQPVVTASDAPPPNSSYTIEFKGKKYVCPTKDYPYPGFTNENIVCCFKKDQRRRDAYTRNMESKELDIIVRPSNFKIKVKDEFGKEFITYVIKIVSEYITGFNEKNSMSKFFYIDSKNMLQEIKEFYKFDGMEEESADMWLDPVPLSKLITDPPKNKCNYAPKLDKKIDDDINAPCKHHDKNKYFGYNLNSYPCCFDKERDTDITRKKKHIDITKQHILISDKILDFQRIGVLPDVLDILFNGPRSSGNSGSSTKYYRMGVVQNSAALLGAILLVQDNIINGKTLNNTTEFRNYIAEYIEASPGLFQTLNNGNLVWKYKKKETFLKQIRDTQSIITIYDIIDVLEEITNKHVIIFDIPYIYTESTQVADYKNIKIVCRHNDKNSKNKKKNTVVLLKRGTNYEVIFALDEKANNGDKINFLFQNEDLVIKAINQFYTQSCVTESRYPLDFPFDEGYDLQEVISLLEGSKHSIVAQVVNVYDKVDYALTRKGLLIPVKESGMVKYGKRVRMKQIVGKIPTLKDALDMIDDINKILATKKMIVSKGISISSTGDVTGIFTSFGRFIPIKRGSVDTFGLSILPFKYYNDVDDFLISDKLAQTIATNYTEELKRMREYIYKIKLQLSNTLSSEDRKYLLQIAKNVAPRMNKIQQMVSILKSALTKNSETANYKNLDLILSHISNEMLNDNKENLLINNLVVSDTFDPNEVVKRDEESVLLSIDDVRKWFDVHYDNLQN